MTTADTAVEMVLAPDPEHLLRRASAPPKGALVMAGRVGGPGVSNNNRVNSRFTDADYQLLWPRSMFVQEASKLLNRRELSDWSDRCELLLEDAFIGGVDGGR